MHSFVGRGFNAIDIEILQEDLLMRVLILDGYHFEVVEASSIYFLMNVNLSDIYE